MAHTPTKLCKGYSPREHHFPSVHPSVHHSPGKEISALVLHGGQGTNNTTWRLRGNYLNQPTRSFLFFLSKSFNNDSDRRKEKNTGINGFALWGNFEYWADPKGPEVEGLERASGEGRGVLRGKALRNGWGGDTSEGMMEVRDSIGILNAVKDQREARGRLWW